MQLALPTPLKYKDGLFICKEGKRESMLQMIFDAELGAIIDVEESSKELKPSHLNKFDIVIVDDSIKLS